MKARRSLVALAALSMLVLAGCAGGNTPAQSESGLSGDPVTIGAVAPLKGAAAYPEAQYGIDAAVNYVNTKLGGINGHPFKIETCAADGTPETSITCANKFVTEGMPAVLDANDLSLVGANPVLSQNGGAGIPIVGTFPAHPQTGSGPYGDAFFFTGPTGVTALGLMTAISNLDVKTFALITVDISAGHDFWEKSIDPIAQKLGMQGTPYFLPTSPNYTVLAASIMAQNPDAVVIGVSTEDGCTQLFTNLLNLGYKGIIHAGSCSKFITDMGAKANGFLVQARTWLPAAQKDAPKEVSDQIQAFKDSMAAIGQKDNNATRAVYAFAGAVNTALVLQKIDGKVTNKSTIEAFKKVKDMTTYLSPVATCSGDIWPNVPSACAAQAIAYKVKDGVLVPLEKAGYFDLDLSLLP
jgi:branched-chain amino acid transport system substrate-binding protein